MTLATLETDIKSHLVALVLTVALIFGSVYGVESIIAKHDALNNSKWQTILTQSQAKSSADEEKLEATLTALSAQNASLTQTISQRNTELSQEEKTDASLTPTQTAQKLGGTEVDPQTIALPLDTARGIIGSLDTLATTTANLDDETKIADNLQTELNSQTSVVSDLKTQLRDQTKACTAEVTAVKAQARKSKLKWFLAGVVAGLTAGRL